MAHHELLLCRSKAFCRLLGLSVVKLCSPCALVHGSHTFNCSYTHYYNSGMTAPLLPPITRSMATISRGDHEFLRIIRDEIAQEVQAEAQLPQQEVGKILESFTVDDRPGAGEVFFCRTYKNEDIKVSCIYRLEDLPEELEDDLPDAENPPIQLVQMVVQIFKGGKDPLLEVECATDGNEPIISRVAYKEAAAAAKDVPYDGPQFVDLDPQVQNCFRLYLSARGINATFGRYVLGYMVRKEQHEYTRWLKNVENFVSK